MTERNLSHFHSAIAAAVGSLPDGIEPAEIARALVDGAGSSGRCDAQSIATACNATLEALNFGPMVDRPPSDRPQIAALEAFRGSLDSLCEGLGRLGILPTEIAEILGMQAFAILDGDHPLAAEIFARAAERLPAPRDLAA